MNISIAKNALVLLLLGMTRAGKTTKVASLSSIPWIISLVCGKTGSSTPVTTDWRYNSTLGNEALIRISEIQLKPQAVFLNVYSHSVDGYNKCLAKNPCLVDVFNFEEIDENVDVDSYVEKKINNFIANSDLNTIINLMKNKEISSVITKITIDVPPSLGFKNYLNEIGIETITLRDTRGMLDLNINEIDKIQQMSMHDLGLDGIDGVLLLGNSFEFPTQAGDWYKNVYSLALKSVPIFMESRHDMLHLAFQMDQMQNTERTVSDFLMGIPENTLFKDIDFTHFYHSLKLLSTFEAATCENDNWTLSTNLFNLNDSKFLIPTSVTLAKLSASEPVKELFSDPDYLFFQEVTLCNIKRMIDMVIQARNLFYLINQSGHIASDFANFVSGKIRYILDNNAYISMYPNYRSSTASREDVNDDLKKNQDYLGPKSGITTMNRGRPKYLAAVTLATTSHMYLYHIINQYPCMTETLKDSNGKEIASNISLSTQNRLVRMYLNNKLYKSSDSYAYFKEYVITDRYLVVNTLKECHTNNLFSSNEDALTISTREVIRNIYK